MKRDYKGGILGAVMLLMILWAALAQREAMRPVKEQMDPEMVHAALAGPSGMQWYTELHDIGWRGRYGFGGSAMVEIEPWEGIDSVVIQGSLTHLHEESLFSGSERRYETVFQTELELIWPKEKEEIQ